MACGMVIRASIGMPLAQSQCFCASICPFPTSYACTKHFCNKRAVADGKQRWHPQKGESLEFWRFQASQLQLVICKCPNLLSFEPFLGADKRCKTQHKETGTPAEYFLLKTRELRQNVTKNPASAINKPI